ncbi:transposase, partial [Rhabdochromatium marinum]|uniref:transposase n=1 Tax=Rhabdochromatium marinum TaxID=48729 RepID=UPI001908EF30
LIVDRAFTDFAQWAALSGRGVTWLTRAKSNLKYEVDQLFVHTSSLRDRVVWVGQGATRQRVRLIEIQGGGTVCRYLTNALDLLGLPTAQAAALYAQRWRVEDAFAIAKRLLELAYFYGGAQNAVELQLLATWILYAVLVDLTDAVAEALGRPFADISMEMLYRSLYFVVGAQQHDPTLDPVRYLAEDAKTLGIIKRPRKAAQHKTQASVDFACHDDQNLNL